MNSKEKNTAFRNLPSVDSILNSEQINNLEFSEGTLFVTEIIREELVEARESISNNQEIISADELILKIK